MRGRVLKRGWVCSLVLFILCSLSVGAAPAVPSPTNWFFVNDGAGVMDTATEQAIYDAGAQLYEKTGAQVVAVTVTSLDGYSIEEYALTLGREWGVGDAEQDNGIVLLLAVEEREVRIEVGYGLEGAVPDARSGILLDNYAVPYFREDDFDTGMRETYNAIVNEVYLEYGMEADPNYTPADELEEELPPLASLIAMVVMLIVLSTLLRGRGWIFPLFFGGSNHHHRGGGGGFGGSFRGGGFSGGGGSFGGGGASRGF